MALELVPPIRVRAANAAPYRPDGDYVLYWMIAARRTTWNFGLERAVELAVQWHKPLVILEPLRVGYRWASDRFHRFAIDGMAEHASELVVHAKSGVTYYPYVEPAAGAGRGLLAALARVACAVVTDDFPCFFLPRMVAAAAAGVPVRLEAVDSNGLLPLAATDRVFTTAFSFRAFLQKQLPTHLERGPRPDPLVGVRLPPLATLPPEIVTRWPPASRALLAGHASELAALPIDHTVGAVDLRGGSAPARQRLAEFLDRHLSHYAAGANDPDRDNRSALAPYLHVAHVSSHEVFHALMARENWSPESLGERTGGKRVGWWGASPGAEAWLDQLVTWRELGFNMAAHAHDFDRYVSLPAWARATLDEHRRDARPVVYTTDQLAAAATHDSLWNAAQTQLVREGRIHNYLRMLWGKKILEWSPSPEDALAAMIELNNRYALDGRDPNSYAGICWVLGRYDRPWGPPRPIFGTVRYMSSDNTRRKLHVGEYLRIYGQP